MTEQEGVIKYRLEHCTTALKATSAFFELNALRSLLWRVGVIGQDPLRYDGLGYGNVSLRLAEGFLITATQTGQLPQLSERDYAWVRDAIIEQNYLASEGPTPPSSEALTHAAVYQAELGIQCVAHGHSPEIWETAAALQLPCVENSIEYGTTAMANAVQTLTRANPKEGVIVMLGHRDGLLTYAQTPERAGWLMIQALLTALEWLERDGSKAKERP